MKIKYLLTCFLFLLVSLNLVAAQKLVWASVLFRHGDRTPISKLPACPFAWAPGLGELTPLGMHQEYILGTELRERYVVKNKILPEHFDTNLLYVRSSDVNRTLQSAESLLCGLYPPGTGPALADKRPALPNFYQPIPIHTEARSKDFLLNSQYIFKDKLKDIFQEEIYNNKEWLAKEAAVKDDFKLWSLISGLKIKRLENTISFGTNIFIRTIHNVSLPKGVDEKNAEKLISLASWIVAARYKPKNVGIIVAGKLLQHIFETMNDFIKGNSRVRCYLYSGHDANVLAMMSTLGLPVNKNPGYASCIQFELYKDGKKYFVKMIFNGKTVNPPFFSNSYSCSIKIFDNYIKKLLI
jgi:lysosomal acid phosphatase